MLDNSYFGTAEHGPDFQLEPKSLSTKKQNLLGVDHTPQLSLLRRGMRIQQLCEILITHQCSLLSKRVNIILKEGIAIYQIEQDKV